MAMRRRECLKKLAYALLSAQRFLVPSITFAQVDQSDSEQADWKAWKDAFLTTDGRVVDHQQNNASHSEGQGYGMVLAVWFGDADAFRCMQAWTIRFLAVRQDPLLAWRWQPNQIPHIADYNNASDGDLFYAWALLGASHKFGDRAYVAQAVRIAHFLAESCIRPDPRGGARLLLLPGAERFSVGDKVIVNPSYYMPLALRDLGAAAGVQELLRCADDGEALLAEVASTGLVPDWIEIGPNGWSPASDRSPQSGYDALRTALFLIWSGKPQHLAVRRAATLYPSSTPPITTVADLSGQDVIATSDLPGYVAIASLVRCANGSPPDDFVFPLTKLQPYYPATLELFCKIAARQEELACKRV